MEFLRDPIESENLKFFPKGNPDETFSSIMGRFSLIYCLNSNTELYKKLFARACITGVLYTDDLRFLAQRVVAVEGESFYYQILHNHTFHSLITWFCNKNTKDPFLNGNDHIDLRCLVGHKLCLACVDEDVQVLGFTYLRRSHQVPGVECCWKHSTHLIHQASRAGSQSNSQSFNLGGAAYAESLGCVEAAGKEEVDFARFIHHLLNSKLIISTLGKRWLGSAMKDEVINECYYKNAKFNSGTSGLYEHEYLARSLKTAFKYFGSTVEIEGSII